MPGPHQRADRNDYASDKPLILTIPGLNNSGPDHWQTKWEAELPNCQRVDLGLWDRPNRNVWISKLGIVIRNASRPVYIVAHSLGCHALAWWAQNERPAYLNPIAGALLVAPPELDSGTVDQRLMGFAPTPLGILPFPSIVVSSGNDPYIDIDRARRLAFFWGSEFADAGHVGHINAESGLGHWDFGLFLLSRLTGRPYHHAHHELLPEEPRTIVPYARDLSN